MTPKAQQYQRAIDTLTNARKVLDNQAAIAAVQDPESAKPLYAKIAAIDKATEQYRQALIAEQATTEKEKDIKTGTTAAGLDIAEDRKLYTSLVGQGRTGITMGQDAIEARALLQHPDLYTGLGAETAAKTVQLARMLGLPTTSKLPELLAAMNKTTSSSILNQMSLLKAGAEEGGAGSAGRVFAPEVEQMIKSSASPDNPKGANLYLQTLKERTGWFFNQISDQAIAYKRAHGSLDAGFDAQLAQTLGSHHAVTPQEMQNPMLLAAREFSSPAEALKAKAQNGETIRVRTGPNPMDFRYVRYNGAPGAAQ
jgi:hypothetical protein